MPIGPHGVVIRLAELPDVPAIAAVIARSVRALGSDDYGPEQIDAALSGAFGVDSQLIRDRTYYVGDVHGQLVLCGGFSRRETDFGGDAYPGRAPLLLDPASEAARIRAFFVDPGWARRGLASALLALCEMEISREGFRAAELTATLPGERLYARHGYRSLGPRLVSLPGGVAITFVRMVKVLAYSRDRLR